MEAWYAQQSAYGPPAPYDYGYYEGDDAYEEYEDGYEDYGSQMNPLVAHAAATQSLTMSELMAVPHTLLQLLLTLVVCSSHPPVAPPASQSLTMSQLMAAQTSMDASLNPYNPRLGSSNPMRMAAQTSMDASRNAYKPSKPSTCECTCECTCAPEANQAPERTCECTCECTCAPEANQAPEWPEPLCTQAENGCLNYQGNYACPQCLPPLEEDGGVHAQEAAVLSTDQCTNMPNLAIVCCPL
ncbi:hypothetical protein DUNSADRAFT_12194 [Dunaliella salina]|uniref:Uncharacterized protein n=1 Tax=Dunaliella salina TaxID=3046 RepID=A0ABQ7GBQ7_DUNSA|nr:hypothetical protein DUNSADRAFT_12194 [Dunaliella salina]|eukprot:KAF5832051.1 hypothetical protein DUNSADRAFT_12194 [Dunaliella salina]